MLAPPPPPIVVDFDVRLRGRYRIRRSGADTEDGDESDSYQSSSPSSPDRDDEIRTTSWKRKRVGDKATWVENEAQMAQLQLTRSESALDTANAELEATQTKLREAQQQLAKMACALATATHECGICRGFIAGSSAVGSDCMCHFCLPCLTDAVANGACACPKCGAAVTAVKPDPEFDALLGATTQLNVSEEENAVLEAAIRAVAGSGRVVAADAAQEPPTTISLARAKKGAAEPINKAAAGKGVTFAWPFVRSFSFSRKR